MAVFYLLQAEVTGVVRGTKKFRFFYLCNPQGFPIGFLKNIYMSEVLYYIDIFT